MNGMELLSDLLYAENNNDVINSIRKISKAELLYVFSFHYNWGNGFEIPQTILDNENCDLGNALLLFYDASGFNFLQDQRLIYNTGNFEFLKKLYNRILERDFNYSDIEYIPSLTNVQKYKLKRVNPEIHSIFLDGTIGKKINVSII